MENVSLIGPQAFTADQVARELMRIAPMVTDCVVIAYNSRGQPTFLFSGRTMASRAAVFDLQRAVATQLEMLGDRIVPRSPGQI